MKQYVIKGKVEETECDECGCPLYNMDRAYYNTEDDGKAFCSRHCAAKSQDPPRGKGER